LTEEVRVYETSMEMMEGSANYVARRAVGESPARTADRLRAPRTPEATRWRFYDSGAALCFVAERLLPGWREQLETEPRLTVVELLGDALVPQRREPAAFTDAEIDAFGARAAAAIADLASRQQRLRAELFGRRASRIVIDVAPPAEAFRIERFDPINLMVLGEGHVAHPHFLALAGSHGTIDVTNTGYTRQSYAGTVALTVSAGGHPLRDGIRALTIVGLNARPRVEQKDDQLTVEAPGVRLSLHGAAVTMDGDIVRISVLGTTGGSLSRHHVTAADIQGLPGDPSRLR
jgi:hypothetical protein